MHSHSFPVLIAEGATLVPDCRADGDAPQIMDQGGSADSVHVDGFPTELGGAIAGQLGDSARMAEQVGDLEIGEIGEHCEQTSDVPCRHPPWSGLGVAEFVGFNRVGERSSLADSIDDRWVVGTAPAALEHRYGRHWTPFSFPQLDVAGNDADPYGDRDRGSDKPVGMAQAVPALEGVTQRHRHANRQRQPTGQQRLGQG